MNSRITEKRIIETWQKKEKQERDKTINLHLSMKSGLDTKEAEVTSYMVLEDQKFIFPLVTKWGSWEINGRALHALPFLAPYMSRVPISVIRIITHGSVPQPAKQEWIKLGAPKPTHTQPGGLLLRIMLQRWNQGWTSRSMSSLKLHANFCFAFFICIFLEIAQLHQVFI